MPNCWVSFTATSELSSRTVLKAIVSDDQFRKWGQGKIFAKKIVQIYKRILKRKNINIKEHSKQQAHLQTAPILVR